MKNEIAELLIGQKDLKNKQTNKCQTVLETKIFCYRTYMMAEAVRRCIKVAT